MARSLWLLSTLLLAIICIATTSPARAQLPENLQKDPAALIRAVTVAIQTGDDASLQQWLTTSAYLGLKTKIENLSANIRYAGVIWNITPAVGDPASFSISVFHLNGSIKWQVAIDVPSSRLSKLDFSWEPPEGMGQILSGQILGGPNSVINKIVLGDNNSEITKIIRDPSALCPLTQPKCTFPENRDPRVVEFLFATVRQRVENRKAITFTGERSPSLQLGAASVRIPEDHKIGRIELPQSISVFGLTLREGRTDEEKHFVIRSIKPLNEKEWASVVKRKASKSALVFVHGYANSFQDALFRNAQIVWDLQYNGLSVLFSWASAGDVLDYVYDLNSANLARPAFIDLLRKLQSLGVERIDVLAHSMGNFVVLDALASHASTISPVKIGELLMAAPDVDRDTFVSLIPKVQKLAKGLTLYASSADKALIASRIPAKKPRAGDVPDGGPVVLPRMETIDVTKIGDELLGLNHSQFATNRVIMDDIKLILSTGMRPPSARLSQIRAYPEPPKRSTYWRYAP